ncbi:MAG: GDSL-type esterase/lipase family protein [Myxococcota bacterium]|nr:GDSL-type esterase/lipase family protein [Myxococcota bacterium]
MGPVSVQGFLPEPGGDAVWNAEVSSFRATGGNAIAGEIGPLRLGELVLAVTGNDWRLELDAGSVVAADFSLGGLSPKVVAVPEPIGAAPLLLGVILLGGLARRGRRRSVLAKAGLLLWVGGLAGAPDALAQDSDFDGIPDASDNCVFAANPSQADSGGLLGPAEDGIGDACQCGDLNSDGQIDLLDVAIYQRDLAGLLPEFDAPGRCSVTGGRLDCEPNDAYSMREAVVGLAPGIAQVCDAAVPTPAAPIRMAAAGDSITQAFSADCTCNAGFLGLLCLLCPAGGDQAEHSWFNGASLGGSFEDQYGLGAGISSARVSVSGAEMRGTGSHFSTQADDLLALVPLPELVTVELGGNDICNRDCVDPANCANPLYTEAEWEIAIRAGLDKLVGFNHPLSLPAGATVYLLGVPRVQDLYAAGVQLEQSQGDVNCRSFWDTFDVCTIATLDTPLNGETHATRLTGIESRVQLYNEVLRDLAWEYSTNATNRNPLGIEVVADYVNESTPSVGTTSFDAGELNGGDCFHPNLQGQRLIATEAWNSNPREGTAP